MQPAIENPSVVVRVPYLAEKPGVTINKNDAVYRDAHPLLDGH